MFVASGESQRESERVHQGSAPVAGSLLTEAQAGRYGPGGPSSATSRTCGRLWTVMRDRCCAGVVRACPRLVTLRWGDVNSMPEAGRLHVVRSKTDQTVAPWTCTRAAANGWCLYTWGQGGPCRQAPAGHTCLRIFRRCDRCRPAETSRLRPVSQLDRFTARIKAATQDEATALEVWPESGLAGFRATSISRITGLTGIIIYVIRFNNPLLHRLVRYSMSRKQQLEENRGFRPDF